MAKNELIPIIPDGKWHIAIKTPHGYGFDLEFDMPVDFEELILMMAKATKEPGGIARAIEQSVLDINKKQIKLHTN